MPYMMVPRGQAIKTNSLRVVKIAPEVPALVIVLLFQDLIRGHLGLAHLNCCIVSYEIILPI